MAPPKGIPEAPCRAGPIALLQGRWGELAHVFRRAYEKGDTAVTNNPDWKGDRATRFNEWWDKAWMDMWGLYTTSTAVADILNGLRQSFLTAGDSYVAAVTAIKSNCDRVVYDADGGPWVVGILDADGWEVNIHPSRGFFVWDDVGGRELYDDQLLPWMTKAKGDYNSAKSTYESACKYYLELLQGMAPIGDAFKQVPREHVEGVDWADESGFGTDPTWNQLTGGGVLKPDGSSQFEGDQPKLPGWYDPPPKSNWEKAHDTLGSISTVAEILGLVATVAGQPEIAGPLFGVAAVTKGGQVVTDLAQGNGEEAALDGVDLVLGYDGVPKLAAGVAEKIGAHEYGKDVSEKVTEYIQGQIKEHVTENEKGEQVISASDLNAIAAEAKGKAEIWKMEGTNADSQKPPAH